MLYHSLRGTPGTPSPIRKKRLLRPGVGVLISLHGSIGASPKAPAAGWRRGDCNFCRMAYITLDDGSCETHARKGRS
jgi:hypothetical protein